jgi:hypothetical protein
LLGGFYLTYCTQGLNTARPIIFPAFKFSSSSFAGFNVNLLVTTERIFFIFEGATNSTRSPNLPVYVHLPYTQDINLFLPRDRQELDRLFEGLLSHLHSPQLSLQLHVGVRGNLTPRSSTFLNEPAVPV